MNPRRVSERGTSGFSLVEVLIAGAVLSIALLGALAGQLSSSSLLQKSREMDIATGVLQSTMDRLLATPVEDLIDPDGPYPIGESIDTGEVYLGKQIVVFAAPGYTPGDPTPDVLNVSLNMSWTSQQGQPESLSLLCTTR